MATKNVMQKALKREMDKVGSSVSLTLHTTRSTGFAFSHYCGSQINKNGHFCLHQVQKRSFLPGNIRDSNPPKRQAELESYLNCENSHAVCAHECHLILCMHMPSPSSTHTEQGLGFKAKSNAVFEVECTRQEGAPHHHDHKQARLQQGGGGLQTAQSASKEGEATTAQEG